MPFQVSYSQRAIPAGIIQSFDAGDDAVTICDPAFSLTATIVGDLTGHTIEWIQIEGSPVTFTTPLDQLAVTYTQTIFDDKIFRFFIDRGTASEVFDDVSIFGSPTESRVVNNSNTLNNVSLTSTLSLNGDSVFARLLSGFSVTKQVANADVDVYTNAVLFWNKPITDFDIIEYLIQEETTHGVFVTVATNSPDNTQFTDSIIGNRYRVVTMVKFANSHIGTFVSNIVNIDGLFFNAPSIVVTEPICIQPNNTSTNIGIGDYTIERLSLIAHPVVDDIRTFSSINTATNIAVNEYTVQTLSLVAHPTIPEMRTFDVAGSIRNVAISNYDVQILTGDQIGG